MNVFRRGSGRHVRGAEGRLDRPQRSHLADFPVTIQYETANAWKVFSHNTGVTAWVPKSVGELDGETMTMPELMAEEKGLI